ncbi:MAG: hypothetical protein A3A28_00590 [Candidatus Sungbacteria bacterium RIFCSPLOWO2_01_FULL_47_32]|uniref:Uncharacterized protein n=1 Tax=Candidatus Sungbacteria bacterium RIFCSPHIGHO2_01_FULL_47_32 TaxID=1802264 RepID=A0A1G2K712_9BACT|nr:MAG: hypothetical protein A2633_00160 [Candidatus Sungbacteria bacterium RIFCSPHIGHO2_01_FULL_47_32]OHA05395.1 MAG: hypothetical protein A3A28_00590 [Candidatus Sungbacteria bacterium RIFCSPLOWO2_01_FULL_47_32]
MKRAEFRTFVQSDLSQSGAVKKTCDPCGGTCITYTKHSVKERGPNYKPSVKLAEGLFVIIKVREFYLGMGVLATYGGSKTGEKGSGTIFK